jgi:hypothetical protein
MEDTRRNRGFLLAMYADLAKFPYHYLQLLLSMDSIHLCSLTLRLLRVS